MKDYLNRVSIAIEIGITVEDIHDLLAKEGMSEYDIFLTYMGAKLVVADRSIKL